MVCVPRSPARVDSSTTGTVPPPKQMSLLNMSHQPFFAKCGGIRAILPPAYEAEGAISDTVYPMIIPQMGREVEALNGGAASRAAFHPATDVWAEFWRTGNGDQPPGVLKSVRNSERKTSLSHLVCEIVIETVVVAVCHWIEESTVVTNEARPCPPFIWALTRPRCPGHRDNGVRMFAHSVQHGNCPRRLQGLACMIYYFPHLNVVGLVAYPTRGCLRLLNHGCHIDMNLPVAPKDTHRTIHQSQYVNSKRVGRLTLPVMYYVFHICTWCTFATHLKGF